MEKKQNLEIGTDVRGDYALFIEEKFISGWELLGEVKEKLLYADITFFRVIRNGIQTSSHGFLEQGKIVQWG